MIFSFCFVFVSFSLSSFSGDIYHGFILQHLQFLCKYCKIISVQNCTLVWNETEREKERKKEEKKEGKKEKEIKGRKQGKKKKKERKKEKKSIRKPSKNPSTENGQAIYIVRNELLYPFQDQVRISGLTFSVLRKETLSHNKGTEWLPYILFRDRHLQNILLLKFRVFSQRLRVGSAETWWKVLLPCSWWPPSWLHHWFDSAFAPLVGFGIVGACISCVFLSDFINLPYNYVAVSGT